jgi:hypothetical protein
VFEFEGTLLHEGARAQRLAWFATDGNEDHTYANGVAPRQFGGPPDHRDQWQDSQRATLFMITGPMRQQTGWQPYVVDPLTKIRCEDPASPLGIEPRKEIPELAQAPHLVIWAFAITLLPDHAVVPVMAGGLIECPLDPDICAESRLLGTPAWPLQSFRKRKDGTAGAFRGEEDTWHVKRLVP